MKDFLRRRGPTAIAVVLAFIVGGATVTTAQNLITSADIKDGAVKRVDLANGAVNSPKIADGQVKNADLINGAVNSAKIADGQVKNADLINGAVNSAKIADGQVKSADLANGGVANADLANNAVNAAKIANGAVGNSELANNAVNSAKVADGSVTSADIANGTIQIGDISAAAQNAFTAYSEPNWSIVDRNVLGNGDAYLRAGPSNGPVTPPSGVGSLGLRTGAATDKAAFGNQVDFIGMPLPTAVGFSVFTTQENNSRAPNNMPSIAFEIDPNVTGISSNFSTMVYVPSNGLPLVWTPFNAVTDPDPHWGLTGAAFVGTPCHIDGSLCRWEDLMSYLDDGAPAARVLIVQVQKGSDFVFSGAVDNLRINDTVYNFEPNGVFPMPATP